MKTYLAVILTGMLAVSAGAQQSILAHLPTTTLAGASTNAGPGPGFISWNIDQIAVVQITAIGTNAEATAPVVVRWQESLNGTDWITKTPALTVTPAGLTAGSTLTRLTNTSGSQHIRVASQENSNATAVTFSRFTLKLKEQ